MPIDYPCNQGQSKQYPSSHIRQSALDQRGGGCSKILKDDERIYNLGIKPIVLPIHFPHIHLCED